MGTVLFFCQMSRTETFHNFMLLKFKGGKNEIQM